MLLPSADINRFFRTSEDETQHCPLPSLRHRIAQAKFSGGSCIKLLGVSTIFGKTPSLSFAGREKQPYDVTKTTEGQQPPRVVRSRCRFASRRTKRQNQAKPNSLSSTPRSKKQKRSSHLNRFGARSRNTKQEQFHLLPRQRTPGERGVQKGNCSGEKTSSYQPWLKPNRSLRRRKKRKRMSTNGLARIAVLLILLPATVIAPMQRHTVQTVRDGAKCQCV